MKLKDFFAFKDWLSYRQKVGLLVLAGVVCGLGGLFMYLLRAHTYFIGDNPSACVNCHIMTPYYATWSHSSHGRIDHQSNGATFHAPQEVVRLLSHSVDYAQQARLLIARVAAKHGHTDAIPVPDYSTKAKAQAAIGLDMKTLNENKQKFLQEIEPKWIEEAKKNGKLIEI